MAENPEALRRNAEEQAKVYNDLKNETRSMISAQRTLTQIFGLQKTSILGSIANVALVARENLKMLQLKRQEQKMLQAQLLEAKRRADIDRREMQAKAALYNEYLTLSRKRRAGSGQLVDPQEEARFQDLDKRRRELNKSAAKAAQKYEQSSGQERSIASQLNLFSDGKLAAAGKMLGSVMGMASVAVSSFVSAASAAAKALIGLSKTIDKVQKDFGISMDQAAKLQMQIYTDTFNNMVRTFKSVDFTGLGTVLGDAFSSLFDFGRDVSGATFFNQGTFADAFSSLTQRFGNIFDTLGQARPGTKPIEIFLSPEERSTSIKAVQDEFGVFDYKTSEAIGKFAKERGLTAQQVVQARRVFATQTLGDYTKIEKIQDKFLNTFKEKGLTAKTAMETIGKYSELLAKNGLRFADSFTRAAASAKKIGVDLSKVDQIGDNIISNFEGFLEGQAELGAMGFGFDSSRLAELAETGDTGAFYNELRSQLAATGKDITKLRRSEQLALQNTFGVNMSDIMRMAGKEPEKTPEEIMQAEQTSLLNNIIGALGPLETILEFVRGPGGLILAVGSVTTAIGVLTDIVLRGFEAIPGIGNKFKAEAEARRLFSENNPYMARNTLRQAGVERSIIEKMTQDWLSRPGIQDRIKAGNIKNASYSPSANKFIFYDPTRQLQPGYEDYAMPGTQWPGGISRTIEEQRKLQEEQKKLQDQAYGEQIKQRIDSLRAAGKIPTRVVDEEAAAQRSLKFKQQLDSAKAAYAAQQYDPFTNQLKIFADSIKATGGSTKTKTDAETSRIFKQQLDSAKAANSPVKKAQGGMITGPGTSTSDSIPARLSNGEYVINAKSSGIAGSNLLNTINSAKNKNQLLSGLFKLINGTNTYGFAEGGPVGTSVKQTEEKVSKFDLKSFNKIIEGFNKIAKFGEKIDSTANKITASDGGLNKVADLEGKKGFMSKLSGLTSMFSKKPEGTEGESKGFMSKISGLADMFSKKPEGTEGESKGFMSKITGLTSLFSKKPEGAETEPGGFMSKISGLTSMFSKKPGEIPATGEKKGFMSKMGDIAGILGVGKAPGEGGESKTAMSKFSEITGLFAKKQTGPDDKKGFMGTVSGIASIFGKKESEGGGTFAQKALSSAQSIKGVGKFLEKVPGFGGVASAIAGGEGIKGAITSTASAGVGKWVGGLLGSAIPIPGVGTLLGSLAGDWAGKKLGGLMSSAGSGVKKLFTKGKDGKSMAGKIAGYTPAGLAVKGLNKFADSKIGKFTGVGLAKKALTSKVGKSIMKYSAGGLIAGGVGKLLGKKKPQAVPAGMEAAASPDLSMMMDRSSSQEPVVVEPKAATVDTKGIEQQLSNFINALQNIQINMDGSKVAKVLVNASDAAAVSGLFRAQSR